MALPRDLAATTEADIGSLIAEQATEGAYLDLKRELPGRNDAARHEFLADVSAFANSAGGDLVYGVDEDGEGRAVLVVAQTGNADQETRRLQDVLLHGIQPRIPGIQVQTVMVNGGFVLVVRVPQSWAGPHRVNTNQHFFVREGARKRQLDVPEIRGMFLRSERQAESVRNFRTERLGKLMAGEAPHRLVPGALLVGHFVPTQAALGLVQVNPIPYMLGRALPVLGITVPGARVNADGALVVRNPRPEGTHGYSQLFRNGYFETVKVLAHAVNERAPLGSLAYEEHFIALLDRLRAEYQHLGIGLEITCMVSIIGANHVELGLDRWRYNIDDHQGFFDRPTLVLPDVLLPMDQTAALALRPVFDLVWQSAGLIRSFNYNEAGEWAPN
ncbi:RNA-binding domain-containing protein [Variovorax sp. NFACC27]|uniref:RNA-binding domain-containing protein n=1 Tax=unclassified Variovorax TaxID=663243 RepID=UPI0008988A55|nr:Putative DNA-binding domain-containing protein [Variovorax sp. NFACC28]SEG91188.1 Putative DNA-binding domain-containing protein [Variovorax sp. NFACC29]SFD48196.1 Putative DNA-binding domain-containing protein [Variovorax sp. NFACC26]SFG73377.1 Putative DNA-binding domain-containing protein [Variovorax sp. NFACC27]